MKPDNHATPAEQAPEATVDNTVKQEEAELSQNQLDNAAGGGIWEEARHFLGLDKYDQM